MRGGDKRQVSLPSYCCFYIPWLFPACLVLMRGALDTWLKDLWHRIVAIWVQNHLKSSGHPICVIIFEQFIGNNHI